MGYLYVKGISSGQCRSMGGSTEAVALDAKFLGSQNFKRKKSSLRHVSQETLSSKLCFPSECATMDMSPSRQAALQEQLVGLDSPLTNLLLIPPSPPWLFRPVRALP